MNKFKGIIPALITPVDNTGKVLEKVLRKHLDYLMECGVHGFYLVGSTGEGLVLPIETRESLTEMVISHVRGSNKTVIVHVGAVDTKSAVRLAVHAEKAGADMLASVPPFYYRLDQNSVYNFYQDVTSAVDLPTLIYNIPELTNVTVNYDFAKRLMELKNVTGIKYSSSDLSEMQKIKGLNQGKFQVFFGVDQILLAGLVLGADGGIGGTYNVMAKKFVEIYEAVQNNDWLKASLIQAQVAKYFHLILKYQVIAAMKEILGVIHGMDMGAITGPLRRLTSAERDSLFKDLSASGFFEFIDLPLANQNQYNMADRRF